MGYAIAAIAAVFMLLVGSVQLRESNQSAAQNQAYTAAFVASDMLRIADAINNWRYTRSLPEGELTPSQFSLVPAPDGRIHAAMSGGRLWIWSTDMPGLVPALSRLSTRSALALTVTRGRLLMADGSDMNLALPAGVAEGDVVYLN
ncbi:type IV pilus biogenesis protein PilM [Dickeya dadantii]|uniref:type IV pilus biogenesis protein PilM n=1 Tax=Dickeya dadantii TaxID=204038 RepID=UPI0021D9662C|nr:type IV pilus biogenesis protein PilM [Dickeya dadantii]